MTRQPQRIHELMHPNNRYRIINRQRLLEKLAIPDIKSFERWYIRVLSEQLSKESSRQQFWSKAIAVGAEEWLKATAIKMGIKRYKIFEHKNSKINFLGGALLF